MTLVPNPPWVDQILSDNWEDLVDVLRSEPALLPRVQRRFPAGTAPPRDRPRGPRSRGAPLTTAPGAEYGCGKFGCVLQTDKPGIVCKVTTDASEAALVEMIWDRIGRRGLPGLVRYHKIVQVDTADHAIVAWCLWRDEAWRVGDESLPPAIKAFTRHARNVWMALKEAPELRVDVARAFRRDQRGQTGALRIAAELGAAKDAIEGSSGTIAEALWGLLAVGVLLFDVHQGNIGEGSDGSPVITDPGQNVILW